MQRKAVPGRHSPLVSIIVPARNEQACLGDCLASLVRQRGVALEILVVDDASTDATRSIAASFPGIRVLSAGPLVPEYSGKCNAAQAGADAARGEWLLFTDADTVHQPESLARALAEAREHSVALLSYSPRQEVRGFWERAVMPVVFAELASRYRSTAVCDPASPVAAANGQYLLIRRDAYQAVGGHAAVAHTLLEDVELARAVKQSGRRIRFRYGGDLVRARMYRSFEELRDGWTKNLALLFPDAPRLALRRAAEILAAAAGAGLGIAGLATRRPAWSAAGFGVAALLAIGFLVRMRRARFRLPEAALSPAGLPVFAWLLLRSHRAHSGRGLLLWKGRVYPGERLSGQAIELAVHAVTDKEAKPHGLLDPQV